MAATRRTLLSTSGRLRSVTIVGLPTAAYWGVRGVPTALAIALLAARPADPEAAKPAPGDRKTRAKDGSELVFIPGGEFMMGDDERFEKWADGFLKDAL